MQNNTDNQVFAGFFVRLAAYLIDWVIIGLALLVVRIPVWIASFIGAAEFLTQDFIFQYSIYDIVIYVLKVLYFALLTYFTGATLGKRLLNIRVVSAENRKPTFFEIVFRESVGKFLSSILVGIGYLMVGMDAKKRGLHDMLSDTVVVYYHQKKIPVATPINYQTVHYTASPSNSQYHQPGQYVQPPDSHIVPTSDSNTVSTQTEEMPVSSTGLSEAEQPVQTETGNPTNE